MDAPKIEWKPGDEAMLQLNNWMGDTVRVTVLKVFPGGTVHLKEVGGKLRTNNVCNLYPVKP